MRGSDFATGVYTTTTTSSSAVPTTTTPVATSTTTTTAATTATTFTSALTATMSSSALSTSSATSIGATVEDLGATLPPIATNGTASALAVVVYNNDYFVAVTGIAILVMGAIMVIVLLIGRGLRGRQ